MRDLGVSVLLFVWVGMVVFSIPGVLCVTSGVASLRLTNSLDCSTSPLLPSVNFTSSTTSYVAAPNGPYYMSMLLCTRIITSADSTNTNTGTIDARLTCSRNGTWTLQGWAAVDISMPPYARPTCDTDMNATPPIFTVSGSNNTCVPANLTLWKGSTQGSLSVSCFPTVFVGEPTEQVGDKCGGAIDCATVTLYSATSDDLSRSCSAVSQSMMAPGDKSCQSVMIGNMSYSYRVGCTIPAGFGFQTANYDFTAWTGSSCEQGGGPSFHAAGPSLSSAISYDENGLAYYDLYALNKVSAITSDNYCQPIQLGLGAGGPGGVLSLLARDPTFPQRITVACGGLNRTSGATVYAYERSAAPALSAAACLVGSVRSVHVVPDIRAAQAGQGPLTNCHASDFTQNSQSVFSELIQCHPDGSFDLDLFTYDVNPDPNALHCQPAYHNATIHGTSGQCINKPTLAGPPQPVRIICNGPHLIPNNTNTNGTSTGTGTAGGGSGSATSSSNTNTNTASTSTTAGPSGSISTSSNSGSNPSSSTGSGSGSGSGSGNLPNGGFGFGSRYACATVMMTVACVGISLIF